jgi:hypothetical protein
MATNMLPTIEKLEGRKNYSTWKTQMRYYLSHEELWDFTSIRPDTAANKRRDARALSKLGLLVQPQCLVYFEDAETTMDAWNALQSAYEGKGVNRSCMLLGKLFDVKIKNFNNMENYVTKVLKIAQEIGSTGKALDDDLIATLLLRGLMPEYKPMRLALENSGVELTTDYIKIKLLQEEYNPNSKVSYLSDNILVTNYKWQKSTEHSSEQKPKYVQNQYRAIKQCVCVYVGDVIYLVNKTLITSLLQHVATNAQAIIE